MGLNVLIVDDRKSWYIAAEMERKFRSKDVDFYKALNGDEAVKKVRERDFDLVVLDYNMPGKNGCETARALRRLRPKIKLAGLSDDWSEDLAKEAGLIVHGGTQDSITSYIAEELLGR